MLCTALESKHSKIEEYLFLYHLHFQFHLHIHIQFHFHIFAAVLPDCLPRCLPEDLLRQNFVSNKNKPPAI